MNGSVVGPSDFLTWYWMFPFHHLTLGDLANVQVKVFPQSSTVGVDVLAPAVQELMQTMRGGGRAFEF